MLRLIRLKSNGNEKQIGLTIRSIVVRWVGMITMGVHNAQTVYNFRYLSLNRCIWVGLLLEPVKRPTVGVERP